MSDELTLKAISTYNGNLHNGLTTALEAVVSMVLEEAAKECDTRIEQLEAALRDVLNYSTIGDMPVTIYEQARAALEEK